jgi:hypothetical protein
MLTETAGRKSLEALGDEITTLAAHIHAATARWLELVAEFDRREGWAQSGCHSCAHWVSWRCAIAPGAAREHVRVARRLAELPLIHAAFKRGELSYSQVRALTRVENVEREAELLDLARSCTAAQLERIVRGYRSVTAAEAMDAHADRYLCLDHDEHGRMVLRGRLSREEGALVLRALEAARTRALEDNRARTLEENPARTLDEDRSRDVSAETSSRPAGLVDALVEIADASLASAERHDRSGGDRHQLAVHVDRDDLTTGDVGGELDDGARLAPETTRRLACDCSVVALVEQNGEPLSVGRKTRSIPPAIRRALRRRDAGCRFPGCERTRWVDAHHIRHWADGGHTKVDNLVTLCRHHHRLLHEGGFHIRRGADRDAHDLVFVAPDGRRLANPAPRAVRHDALAADHARRGLRVSAETCVPRWYGERLQLADAVDAVLTVAPPLILRE